MGMKIDLLNIRMDGNIKRPQIRLKMGPAQYYSKRSNSPTGDWNEGFIFVISYHAQLFNTIEVRTSKTKWQHRDKVCVYAHVFQV
jgi:hypothetical protein